MANPDTQQSLIDIAESLSIAHGSKIIVLNIVVAKEGQNPRDALLRQSQIGNAVNVLDGAVIAASTSDVAFTPVVRAARSLAEGIVDAAVEERVGILLMGWSQTESAEPSPLIETVADRCKCHIAFFNLKPRLKGPNPDYLTVGVALGGRNNTALMVDLATAVTDHRRGRVIYFSVIPEHHVQDDIDHIKQVQMDAITRHQSPILFNTEIVVSNNPLEAIISRTKSLDLLLLGAGDARSKTFANVGSFASMAVNDAHCSVLVVKRENKLVSLIPPQR
jgi:hypothetical protein